MSDNEQIRIKDYQIHLPPLGEGAYGKVYRATYRGLSERAMKIFRPGAVDISTMARELEKLSQVAEHKGIVTLHDFDLLHRPPYYAMGLHADPGSDGTWTTRTLERLCGHVDHREGWRLLREIADALAYLHRHQIVHCDIKPSNILLTDETPFHIKICDFGQSRGLAAEGFQPVGTPLYASPEQLRNPRDSADGKGFRWDVYSFGVVAYKLFTGRLPRLQALAENISGGFDAESTLAETSLASTFRESAGSSGGEQLAELTEAVEEIEWPDGFHVPQDRREIIEQCLSLDPAERPADMREVWIRMQQCDQKRVVNRARRLNAIFATLLVIALWASGFAFVQARKAKQATAAAMTASEESEKSARAAVDMALLFVSELDKGEVSGAGADRLYEIVAEHSATFLEARSGNFQASARILRLAAQTASLSGRQALEQGRLEDAIKDYTAAYEIRSQLAADPAAPEELALLASRDLMEIGKIHERNKDYAKAAEAFNESLEWRSQAVGGEGVFSLPQIRELTRSYRALSRVYQLKGNTGQAVSTLDEILVILESRLKDGEPQDLPGYTIESIRVLQLKGGIEKESGDLAAAARSHQSLMALAQGIDESSPTYAEEARSLYLAAVHSLGKIELESGQPQAALELFREEIKLREDTARIRPYDIPAQMDLAEAYAHAARCLDPMDETSRSVAIFYLEQAVGIAAKLPSDLRGDEEIETRVLGYNEALAELLEKGG